ncbi:MAG TPA: hypothetical protein VFH66_15855 [Mycobacteriales bacterium]|nr:hypothetical protein [Mycobacteriales bacterium]
MFRTRTKAAPAVEDSAADVYPSDDGGYNSHALRAADARCVRCNRALTANDEARRKADGSYVHLCC